MTSSRLSIVLGLGLSFGAFAAIPVGSVSSTGPVELSGTTLDAAAVSSWPLVGGDVIATGKSPAVVLLTGKGRVTLAANTRVKVEKQGDQLAVRLLDGDISYDLVAGSDLLFYNGARATAPAVTQTQSATDGALTSGSIAQKPSGPTVVSGKPTTAGAAGHVSAK